MRTKTKSRSIDTSREFTACCMIYDHGGMSAISIIWFIANDPTRAQLRVEHKNNNKRNSRLNPAQGPPVLSVAEIQRILYAILIPVYEITYMDKYIRVYRYFRL